MFRMTEHNEVLRTEWAQPDTRRRVAGHNDERNVCPTAGDVLDKFDRARIAQPHFDTLVCSAKSRQLRG